MKIVHFPHPTLRRVSRPLRRVDKQLKALVAEMFELMYAAKGIGLAANQVDLPFRLFIVDPTGDAQSGQGRVFLNPVLSGFKGQATAEEGCLSLPGLYRPVSRAEQVHVSAYDLAGNPIDETVQGLLARVIQHETDHLDGVLFIHRLADLDRPQVADELSEFEVAFRHERQRGEIPEDPAIETRLRELESTYC